MTLVESTLGISEEHPLVTPDLKAPKSDTISPMMLVIVLMTFFFHVVLMIKSPLIGDEAYYWLWAKHLAWGYHDHPPLIGWFMAASTTFSNDVFWIRFPALVCAALSSILFYDLGKALTQSARRAGIALSLLSLTPILAISLIAVFPDACLILAWIFCMRSVWKSMDNPKYWLWVGVSIGIAFLSKLMAFLLVASLLSFLSVNPRHRKAFQNRYFWIGMALAIVISSPFWIWNGLHGWENFTFQIQDHLHNPPLHPSLAFLGFLGIQALSVSPVIFFLLISTAIASVKKSWQGDRSAQFIAAFSLPTLVPFILLTWWERVGFHWLVPGYLSLFLGLAAAKTWEKWTARGLIVAAGMALLFYGIFTFPRAVSQALLPLNRAFPKAGILSFLQGKGFGEILGYQALSKAVEQRLKLMGTGKNTFLLTDSYTLSSDLIYYTGEKTCTLLLSGEGGEFSRWNRFGTLVGENALWVNLQPLSNEPEVLDVLRRAFKRLGKTEKIEIQEGKIIRTFYVKPLVGLMAPALLESPNLTLPQLRKSF